MVTKDDIYIAERLLSALWYAKTVTVTPAEQTALERVVDAARAALPVGGEKTTPFLQFWNETCPGLNAGAAWNQFKEARR